MTIATFVASPESQLLLAAATYALGQPITPLRSAVSLHTAKELGNSSGLLPWILDLLGESDESAREAREVYRELCRSVISVQTKSLLDIVCALSSAGINCAALKGMAYAAVRHDPVAIFNDIDLMIPKDSIERSKSVLRRIGYSQNVISHNAELALIQDNEIASFEAAHYELFPFTRIVRSQALDHLAEAITSLGISHPFVIEDGRVYVAAEVDIHHNLSHGIDSAAVLKDAIHTRLDTVGLFHLAWDTHVWFVASRFYHEVMVLGANKIRPLVDLGRVLQFASIDWSRVIRASRTYSLSPSLYYPLSWLAEHNIGSIPEWIIAELNIDRMNQGLHDFGDFLPKALGEAVLLRPS